MAQCFSWLLWLALALTLGCNKPSTSAPAPTAQSTNRQTFEVKGVIKALHPSQKQVEIKHEAVPNYMPAMTMPFDVKDTNELKGLQAGDTVLFRLTVTDTEGWIDQIRKIAPPSTNGPPTNSFFQRVRDVDPLQVGGLLPEYHFTNQLGEAFSTAQFKGQALAITFLFTRCPYPTYCPRAASQQAEAQQKLLAQSGGPTNWHLLTITIDPEFDTPPVLKAYGQFYHYDPAHWTLATGNLMEITALGDEFGLVFARDESGSISHNLRTAVIDASGRLQKIFTGNQWQSEELVAEMAKAALKR